MGKNNQGSQYPLDGMICEKEGWQPRGIHPAASFEILQLPAASPRRQPKNRSFSIFNLLIAIANETFYQ
jgi:hypothetical protein